MVKISSPRRAFLINTCVFLTALTAFQSKSRAAATAEPGVTDTEIRVGESVNQTGQSPEQSIAISKGSELAFRLANEQGGIFGRKIKVIRYDDGYEPRRAFENSKKLVEEDKVFVLFQIYGSSSTKAVMPLLEKTGVPLFAPIGGAAFTRIPVSKLIYNVRASFADEANEAVRFLVEDKKLQKIGIYYQNDAFGEAALSGLTSALGTRGMKRAAQGSYNRNSDDMESGTTEIFKVKPEALLVWGLAKPAAMFIKKSVESGYKPTFVIGSAANQPEFYKILAGVKADIYSTQCVPTLKGSKLPVVQQFMKEATAAGMDPSMAAFEGYLNAKVLIEALKRAGKKLSRESLLVESDNMESFEFGGLKMSFSPSNHQALTRAFLEPAEL